MAVRSEVCVLTSQPSRYGEVSIREMTRADIPGALRLCRLSRWNQVEEDWSLFMDLSPNGCRVAEKNGVIVGTVATVTYQDRFSWIAMMLVHPSERRNGIGRRLVREGLAVLSSCASIRLDATPAGRQLYGLEGFNDEYALARMTFDPKSGFSEMPPRHVRVMTEPDFSAVLQLDCEVFGANREPLLRNLFQRAPYYALVSVKTGVEGYCFGRPGYLCEHIGPVVALREETARDLVSCCLAKSGSRSLLIDAPSHSSWSEWLSSQGFVESRSFMRMYRGANPYPGRAEYLFGIMGPEFG